MRRKFVLPCSLGSKLSQVQFSLLFKQTAALQFNFFMDPIFLKEKNWDLRNVFKCSISELSVFGQWAYNPFKFVCNSSGLQLRAPYVTLSSLHLQNSAEAGLVDEYGL